MTRFLHQRVALWQSEALFWVAVAYARQAFIRNQTWGHHACCTAKIGGAGDSMAVLDSHFRVRGVANLRVVSLPVVCFCHSQRSIMRDHHHHHSSVCVWPISYQPRICQT